MAYYLMWFCINAVMLITKSHSKRIRCELYNKHKITPYLKLSIGNPPVELDFKISTKHSVLYINNDREYDSNNSNSYKSRRETPIHPLINLDNDHYTIGKETIELFNIISSSVIDNNFKFPTFITTNVLIPSMAIVLVDEEMIIGNTLGIGYLSPNNQDVSDYSFLYQLKANQFIDKEVITIQAMKDTFLLEVGELPSEAQTRKNKYKQCRLIPTTPQGDNNHLYQCNFDSFFFIDNTLFPMKCKVTWLITGKTILIPLDVFSFIINRYFLSAINNKECNLQGQSQVNQLLSCNSSYQNENLETLSLIIGKWSIKLSFNELFILTITNENKFFIFQGDANPSLREAIEIGVNVFKRQIAIFNKEDGVFGFLEKEN